VDPFRSPLQLKLHADKPFRVSKFSSPVSGKQINRPCPEWP